MIAMKNRMPFLLCLVGGLLLFFSGYTEGVSTIVLVYLIIHSIAALAPFYLIIDIILFILWMIAWSGGIAVIIGGVLLTTHHVRLGKFIIAIAAGFGLISFILVILYVYLTYGLLGLLVLSWIIVNVAWAAGLILTIIARAKAK